jgi:hypothetical protein
MFTPFHKPPYPYLYGRSVDETMTLCMLVTLYLSNSQEMTKKEKHKKRLVVSKYLEPYFSIKSPPYIPI